MKGPAGIIQKRRRAISLLRDHRAVVVALSGGVDSATLLALACEALGPDRVVAVTGRSHAVTQGEIDDAGQVARQLAVVHEVVDTREIDRIEYRANNGDRCFHCRSELFEVLYRIAAQHGIETIAYGAILDDLGDVRPGMEAARRMGILAPLLDARLSKSEVRVLAKQFNLHIDDKPASPCLASRIPIGTEVTPERLFEVERAEAALRGLGFGPLRVRHHGELARIELDPREIDRMGDPGLRAEAVRRVKAAGFRFVVIDLEGYRSSGHRASPEGGLYLIGPKRDSGQ